MEVNSVKCELELSSQCSLWSATCVTTAVTLCATKRWNVEHQLSSARLLRRVSRRFPLGSPASSCSSASCYSSLTSSASSSSSSLALDISQTTVYTVLEIICLSDTNIFFFFFYWIQCTFFCMSHSFYLIQFPAQISLTWGR